MTEKRRSTSSIAEIISEDRIYIRMHKRLQRVLSQVDIKAYTQELYSLQTSRAVSALKTKSILRDSLRVIVDASVDEISTRSRSSTIKMSSLHALLQVEDFLSHLNKYLLSKYAKQLRDRGFTTITAQKSQIDVYLREFIEAKRSLEGVIKMSDIVCEDIDQVSYALRRVVDVIEQSNKDR